MFDCAYNKCFICNTMCTFLCVFIFDKLLRVNSYILDVTLERDFQLNHAIIISFLKKGDGARQKVVTG